MLDREKELRMETLANVLLVIAGILILRYIVAEIVLHPLSGMIGVTAFGALMGTEGVWHTLFTGDLDAKIFGVMIAFVLFACLAIQIIAWRRNGPIARIIPRMFPVL